MLKWLVLAACALPLAAAAQPKAALDREIPALLAQTHVPSVSVGVIRHGKIASIWAYGEQSPGKPATTRTLYNIASLTKPLTAETVLRLASKGALSLDEPMAPAWTDPDIAGDDRRLKLTARLALSHQSGFPNWRDRKTGLAFRATPGEAVGYSGEGYDYVAHFAEKKTGTPFEDLAQAALFGPEDLKSTAYTGRIWFEGRIAVPTDAEGTALKPYVRKTFSAADVVYTTAGDYAAFMVDVLHDEGLSAEVARERDRIQVSTHANDCKGARAATCPSDIGFGLGWQILSFPGVQIMMHTGKDDGVFTFAYLNRTTGDGAVILTNSDKGAAAVVPILERLGADPAFIAYLKAG